MNLAFPFWRSSPVFFGSLKTPQPEENSHFCRHEQPLIALPRRCSITELRQQEVCEDSAESVGKERNVMLEKSTKPHTTPKTERVVAERHARLAAQLRANLARRKAQGRVRASGDKTPGSGGTAP